jgi:hypothetical protein
VPSFLCQIGRNDQSCFATLYYKLLIIVTYVNFTHYIIIVGIMGIILKCFCISSEELFKVVSAVLRDLFDQVNCREMVHLLFQDFVRNAFGSRVKLYWRKRRRREDLISLSMGFLLDIAVHFHQKGS